MPIVFLRLFTGMLSSSLLFCALILCGCQKTVLDVKCYECEMTYSTGVPAATQYPCSADITQWQKEQKDNWGNPIHSTCKEK